MGNRLDGKVAVITGGTSGIGAATAELFVNEGARVVIAGRSEEKGRQLADRLGEAAVYRRTDVMQEQEIADRIRFANDELGAMHILFNNAGAGTRGTIDSITQEDILHGTQLLLSSVILGIRYAIEPMEASGGGSIINNSSVAAIRHRQGGLVYSAVKAAVTHYTKLAGVELGPKGIRVNSISPGAIATPIFWGGSERANTLSDEENERKMQKLQGNLAKAVPLGVTGLAQDIAYAALYLASDEGRFVNSHDLVVDGGRTSMFYEPS
jgi:NAD(P)-dependent dehydrogenase (short-subunit alcohol dehydrogenase family)